MADAIWKAGEFNFSAADGATVRVAGWVKGFWALDFRVWYGAKSLFAGWALSHIPTGRLAVGILDDLEKAQAIADLVDGLGDWNFTEYERVRDFRDQMLTLQTLVGSDIMVFKHPSMGPNFYYMREEVANG